MSPHRNRHLTPAREFLKSLGAALKLMSLYHAGHPVCVQALEQARQLAKLCHAELGGEIAIGLAEDRWVVNGAPIADASHFGEAMAAVFRSLGLHSVSFHEGLRLFELTAFCKLVALPANQEAALDPGAFLRQLGVRNVQIEAIAYGRVPGGLKPDAAGIANPITESRPGLTARNPHFSGHSFGSFIKGLVDGAVSDPNERAKIYSETLSLVKQALERRVSEATQALVKQNEVSVNERLRTEQALASIADGKVVVDRNGLVLMMDSVAEEIAGKRLIDVAGKPILDSVGPGEGVISLSGDLSSSPDAKASRDFRTAGDVEAVAALRHSMAVVEDEQGRVVGTYSLPQSAVQQKENFRLQKEFVSHVTHELNAPLASICLALELVSELAEAKLNAQETHFLDVSLRNSRQLKQTISEMLDFSKLQSGKMTVKAVPLAVGPIIHEAAEGLRPWALSKKLSLEVCEDAALSSAQVVADHGRIVQVLTNLISNAIKSTPEGGHIVVSAVPEPDRRRVVFCVKDTGCGIPKEDQKKIFDRFTQADGNGKKRDGVGLGLTIVKQLIGLHRGTLWLESEPGAGAAFYIGLPSL